MFVGFDPEAKEQDFLQPGVERGESYWSGEDSDGCGDIDWLTGTTESRNVSSLFDDVGISPVSPEHSEPEEQVGLYTMQGSGAGESLFRDRSPRSAGLPPFLAKTMQEGNLNLYEEKEDLKSHPKTGPGNGVAEDPAFGATDGTEKGHGHRRGSDGALSGADSSKTETKHTDRWKRQQQQQQLARRRQASRERAPLLVGGSGAEKSDSGVDQGFEGRGRARSGGDDDFVQYLEEFDRKHHRQDPPWLSRTPAHASCCSRLCYWLGRWTGYLGVLSVLPSGQSNHSLSHKAHPIRRKRGEAGRKGKGEAVVTLLGFPSSPHAKPLPAGASACGINFFGIALWGSLACLLFEELYCALVFLADPSQYAASYPPTVLSSSFSPSSNPSSSSFFFSTSPAAAAAAASNGPPLQVLSPLSPPVASPWAGNDKGNDKGPSAWLVFFLGTFVLFSTFLLAHLCASRRSAQSELRHQTEEVPESQEEEGKRARRRVLLPLYPLVWLWLLLACIPAGLVGVAWESLRAEVLGGGVRGVEGMGMGSVESAPPLVGTAAAAAAALKGQSKVKVEEAAAAADDKPLPVYQGLLHREPRERAVAYSHQQYGRLGRYSAPLQPHPPPLVTQAEWAGIAMTAGRAAAASSGASVDSSSGGGSGGGGGTGRDTWSDPQAAPQEEQQQQQRSFGALLLLGPLCFPPLLAVALCAFSCLSGADKHCWS